MYYLANHIRLLGLIVVLCVCRSRVCQVVEHTASFRDLDRFSEPIILESILTPFDVSFIFLGSWGSIGNWLEPKIEPPLHSSLFSEGTRKAVLNQLKFRITPPNVIFINLLIILDIFTIKHRLKIFKTMCH
jgi:hypothetical protein